MKIYVPDYMLVPMRDVVGSIGEAMKKELETISNRRRMSAEEKWEQCQPILARITMIQHLWTSLVDAVDMVGADAAPQATVDTQGNGEDPGEPGEDPKQTSYITPSKDTKSGRTRPDPEGDAPEATASD